MFDPLDRPEAQYHWVLNTWLTTPELTAGEAILIRAMKTSLENSLAEFDQMRRIAIQPAFFPTLQSAAAKAIAAGLLTDWNQYAETA